MYVYIYICRLYRETDTHGACRSAVHDGAGVTTYIKDVTYRLIHIPTNMLYCNISLSLYTYIYIYTHCNSCIVYIFKMQYRKYNNTIVSHFCGSA